ncbi:hypothetical protein [Amycolatopsis sp. lyj-346]|uniref:hypothetical protein n=1 Tax=Amycolatopsis sp. lyj-346 TaxID=2789289 RepID=UPI00397D9065
MRLVRLERQQSRVADDIRAALASLGRGSTVIGGIALVGVGGLTERPIEAVVLLPHGVIIVIGVDLPDPALRLEAPLGGPWKADGWPLVADDDSINPATEALDVSQACERQIAAFVPGTAPVGTIIAVGPYVETVDQPATDLAGPVRVLHPTPTTMLAATVSLATAHRPRSVDQVRALIRGLAPSAPEFSDEVLLAEGFSRLTDDAPPESLWDSGPAADGTALPAPAAAASAGVTDWRTETPVDARPKPAGTPEPAAEPELPEAATATTSAAETERTEVHSAPAPDEPPVAPPAQPVFAGAAADTEPTEALLPATQEAPDRPADPAARPVFPGTETTPAPGEAEPTEVLPPPTQQAPNPADDPAGPAFPGTNTGTETAEPPRFPGSPPSAGSEPAESAVAETERTENLSLASPNGEQAEATAPPPSTLQPSEAGPTTPKPAEAGQAGARPAEADTEPEPPSPGGPRPPLPSASPQPFPRPRPEPEPVGAAPRTVRWLPLGAIGALVLLAVAAVAVATTGDGTAAAPAPPPVSSAPAPVTAPVRSLQFALRAAGGDQRCASHAFGDAQASLQQTSCSGVTRASYAATVDGRDGAVTVGIVAFPDAAQAATFKAIADTPGGGGVLDLATETGQWGATPTPRFENAAYASKLDGSSVRLVQAVWAAGPSTPDDPGLVRAAKAALDLPAP